MIVALSWGKHCSSLSIPFGRPNTAQIYQSTPGSAQCWPWVTSLSCSNQYSPILPCFETATHALNYLECIGLCQQSSGGVVPQKLLFFEFTCSERKKRASSENHTSSKKSGFSSILWQSQQHITTRFFHVFLSRVVFNLYLVKVQVQILEQYSSFGLARNGKLLIAAS